MPVPSLLTLEKPRMKRSKSEETIFSDQSERRVYGAGDDDDITMVDSLGSTKKGSNLICIVIAIFGIGSNSSQTHDGLGSTNHHFPRLWTTTVQTR